VSSPTLITDQARLAELCDRLNDVEIVAVDTEFVRERTYFAQLCLIQVAAGSETACIDCTEDLHLEPFFHSLFRSNVSWVAHSARQDLEVFWHAAEAIPQRLHDTQIAAALLGFAPQIGLQELLQQTLGVTLDKSHTRTDWSRRPLSEGALQYAIDDVKYLLPLWNELRSELDRRGRLQWFEEDCRRALQVALVPDAATIFRRLKGSGALRGADVAAALALVDWRERRARQANRPRRWILADDVLVRLARAHPAELEDLKNVAGLSSRTVAKVGGSLVEAVAAASSDKFQTMAKRMAVPERPDPAELKSLQQQVASRATELGIQSEVLAAKRDLVATILGAPPPHLSAGWRAEQLIVGQAETDSSAPAKARETP